ncbi:MAG: UDP-N-acetylmuramate dehydrogenase, partial [Candidatus Komeilibacteria bacterium]|nr:UDP-N-acetylmuramate dehydrogenase [Candidatus Komeilibacteria bacterium]
SEIIKQAVQAALDNNLPYTILGGGANVLIADKGIKGLVIKTENTDVVVAGEIIKAGAGAPLAQIAVKSSQAGLAGLEFAVAIPGSVGGGVRGNAGCYGTEVKDVLTRAHVLKITDKKVEDLWLDNKDCHFAYRESRFKREPFIILEAEFRASSGNKEESMAKMSKWLEQKKATQSVESNCAGCMFKNVAWSDWEKISSETLKREDFDDASRFKDKGVVPTGWIIEQLGLKGYRLGNTMVSEKHGNFLLNMGQATTEQMIQLISYIKMQARDRIGIQLQEEVQYIGF